MTIKALIKLLKSIKDGNKKISYIAIKFEEQKK